MKRRSRKLTQLFQSYRPYDHKVGERQRVLVTEESHDGVHLVAHNKFYDQVGRLFIAVLLTETETKSVLVGAIQIYMLTN